MAQLLYAWELGSGLGHLGAFLPLARTLRERGHQTAWAVAATSAAARLLDREGFAWLQAPRCPERTRPGPPLSYADILLRFGYADAADLLGLTVAWRELIRLSGARMILADHAPTAILAARTLGIPAMLYSSGFCVPPRQRPLPAMRPWQPLATTRLLALEDAALANINRVLDRFGQPALTALWQLFQVAEDKLLGFAELDHYAEREAACFWGTLPAAGVGAAPCWPPLPGKRVFAYLRRQCRHHEAALAALRELGMPAVIFFPDLTDALQAKYSAPHLAFSREPLDLAAAAREADVAITYAGLSTTTSFLLAGKPLLLLPGHLEQYLMARRVAALGAGLVVEPGKPAGDLGQTLRRVIDEESHTASAAAFARKYAAYSQEAVIANLLRRIEEICS